MGIDKLPFGFCRETETRLRVDPAEMDVLQRILREKNAGHTYQQIAEDLNDDGILYRNNLPWTFSACRDALHRALDLCRTRAELADVEATYLPEIQFKV